MTGRRANVSRAFSLGVTVVRADLEVAGLAADAVLGLPMSRELVVDIAVAGLFIKVVLGLPMPRELELLRLD